jgi:hypothetical protein
MVSMFPETFAGAPAKASATKDEPEENHGNNRNPRETELNGRHISPGRGCPNHE